MSARADSYVRVGRHVCLLGKCLPEQTCVSGGRVGLCPTAARKGLCVCWSRAVAYDSFGRVMRLPRHGGVVF